ncbi:MAG: pilus assembly protein [Alphaproteobacteria bacterium]|nr:MAG: pilus assembly protein [Alphaproteobacteria bacterium]
MRAENSILLSDSNGSLAVEYALVIPLTFALLFAMVDVARLLFADVWMRHLATEIADKVRLETPIADRASLTEAGLQAELQALATTSAAGLVNPSAITLTLTSYDSLADTALGTAMETTDLAGENQLIRYHVGYQVGLITPFANLLYANGDVPRIADIMVRHGD